jgi:hypothetical protein
MSHDDLGHEAEGVPRFEVSIDELAVTAEGMSAREKNQMLAGES